MASMGGKKLVRSKSGLKMVTVDEKIQSPFIVSEPEWTPDSSCKVCQNRECQAKFDLFNRKHHCRRCGKCFCHQCSSDLLTLQRMCFVDPVRHCKNCITVTRKENEFFDKHLKVLLNGSVFNILDSNSNPEEEEYFTCRLSEDHRKLEFVGEHSKREGILLEKIESVQIMASETDHQAVDQGNRLGTGIAIRYTVGTGGNTETEIVKMTVGDGEKKKTGMAWIAAMQKMRGKLGSREANKVKAFLTVSVKLGNSLVKQSTSDATVRGKETYFVRVRFLASLPPNFTLGKELAKLTAVKRSSDFLIHN